MPLFEENPQQQSSSADKQAPSQNAQKSDNQVTKQTTGQKIPQMTGTIAEIQLTLSNIQTNQQKVLTNQQELAQRILSLETKLSEIQTNASQQFTNLVQQVQTIQPLRLTHERERKQIEFNNKPRLEEEEKSKPFTKNSHDRLLNVHRGEILYRDDLKIGFFYALAGITISLAIAGGVYVMVLGITLAYFVDQTELTTTNLQDLQQSITTLFAENRCACHIINPHKTRILMWQEKKGNQIIYHLKIGIQKFISQEQFDRNGEIYWRYYSGEPKKEEANNKELPTKSELDPITKFQKRQAQTELLNNHGNNSNSEPAAINQQSN
ncbi:14804_t:CDS:2 [Gigaspora margarita]|uniref:14804_t:CDS:1 n=1 Tax=Gigaspora margarita TaxID=4874 RepID=A0ABN7VSJ6_GIGMA|nr:14804_t:CDS:2 [Gigaspora margarita]